MAVMIERPAATHVAKPLPSIVATDRLDEFQATWALISRFVPSENIPIAVNSWVIPAGVSGMLGLAGLTDMEVRVARVTLIVVVPEISPKMAVTMAVPGVIPLAKPVLSTVATELLDEVQVA